MSSWRRRLNTGKPVIGLVCRPVAMKCQPTVESPGHRGRQVWWDTEIMSGRAVGPACRRWKLGKLSPGRERISLDGPFHKLCAMLDELGGGARACRTCRRPVWDFMVQREASSP